MLGRITPQMTTQSVLDSITTVQDQLAATQQQLSTGKRINQPSDDPYGASLAVSLNTDLSGLTTYAGNITDGTAWASAATASLQNIQSEVQRVQEVVTQAANGTQSAADRAASAAEVNQLIDAVKQEANTQYAGQYVFSGTATATQPYSKSTGDVFQGNTGALTREIGPGSALQVNADLSGVLGSGPTANDGKLLNTLRTIASDLSSGTPAGVADLSNNQIGNLANGLTSLLQLQASVGATQNRLTLASDRVSALQSSDTAALSNVVDANMAQTVTAFSNEQAAFTAALRAGANIVQTSLMQFLN